MMEGNRPVVRGVLGGHGLISALSKAGYWVILEMSHLIHDHDSFGARMCCVFYMY